MRKLRFNIRRPSEEMALQITSMADIFTIILVFLLKSYASGAVSVSPAKGTMLPEARGSDSVIEALQTELTETAVLVDGKPVAELKDFRAADPKEATRGLSTAFETARKRQLLIAQSNTDVKVDPRIVVVADRRAPYVTVKTVLAAAAMQGFTDFKLAVVQGD
jgi:biopolymer transport protein ExbD